MVGLKGALASGEVREAKQDLFAQNCPWLPWAFIYSLLTQGRTPAGHRLNNPPSGRGVQRIPIASMGTEHDVGGGVRGHFQKRLLDPLALELKMVVSLLVGAVDQS